MFLVIGLHVCDYTGIFYLRELVSLMIVNLVAGAAYFFLFPGAVTVRYFVVLYLVFL